MKVKLEVLQSIVGLEVLGQYEMSIKSKDLLSNWIDYLETLLGRSTSFIEVEIPLDKDPEACADWAKETFIQLQGGGQIEGS